MGMMHFSDELRRIINKTHEEAVRTQSREILPAHYMLAILHSGKNKVNDFLEGEDVDLQQFESYLLKELKQVSVSARGEDEEIPISPDARAVIDRTLVEAENLGSKTLELMHLFLALLRRPEEPTCRFLEELSFDCDLLRSKLLYQRDSFTVIEDFFSDSIFNSSSSDGENGDEVKSSEGDEDEEEEKSGFEEFCVDLTALAGEGKLDPVVGRARELERLTQVLCRRKKNNPVIIGEPGVGKTALVEGLAQRIVSQDVPRQLLSKRILMLDMNSVIAGTKYRGQFEERMKKMLDELSHRSDTILYIDELHSIVGAGAASGTLDAANILKQPLARGVLQCIGSTTIDDYRKQIESDAALARRFQKVELEPCSEAMALQILQRLQPRYESYHKVRYTPEALSACVLLTQRYAGERALPDKAIDAMDEAGARVSVYQRPKSERMEVIGEMVESTARALETAELQGNEEQAGSLRKQREALEGELKLATEAWSARQQDEYLEVTEETVAAVVSMMTNVPVQSVQASESERLLRMEEEFSKVVVGQDDAVSVVARAIRRNRSGLRDPQRPIGSFLFLGPTGVGKTYLAKVLARYLFESERNFIRIDMSELQDKSTISRLVGTTPGYVGYEERGQLTEQVRLHPYSVVLFDEIEKAAPEVYNVLLQILDDGRLTDGSGREVDFKNTIIIMTSNVGSRALSEFGMGIGFSTPSREGSVAARERKYIEDALKRHFQPEFLNRIDDLVFFHSLTAHDMDRVLEIEFAKIQERLRALGVQVSMRPAARAFLAREGYDPKYGARPLRRAIQRNVEDLLAELLLRSQVQGEVVIDYKEGKGTYVKMQRSDRRAQGAALEAGELK